MVSQAKVDANRRNAQRSTGPRSVPGKERARFNAVKHGLTARLPVLPGEDSALLRARIDGYKADLMPRGTLEHDLVERMAQESWQIDRALFAEIARVTISVETAAAETALREKDEAMALGQRLFFDPRGTVALYGRRSYSAKLQTSWWGIPDDPNDPARLVMHLESTGAGCRWLLDRWAELRSRLESGQSWHSPEKLQAIRLLGRQPVDAADHPEVTELLLACHVLDPQHLTPFFELSSEIHGDEFTAFLKTIQKRTLESMRPKGAAAARALLLGMIDRVTGRLNGLASAHQKQAARRSSLIAEALAFDASNESERLRRHKNACDRSLKSTIATFLKIRKEVEFPEYDTTVPEETGHTLAIAFEDESDEDPLFVNPGPDFTPDFPFFPVWAAQNEPTDGSDADRQNEPTADDGTRQNEPTEYAVRDLQNEPTADDGNRQNEPTDGSDGHRQNEPTADDVRHRRDDNNYGPQQVMENAAPAGGGPDAQSEPTDSAVRNRQNEPTDGDDDLQNEPTEQAVIVLQNEPTVDDDHVQNKPTGHAVPVLQNEPTEYAVADLQNEPADGTPDRVDDIDSAYREELKATLDFVREAVAESKGFDVARLEQAIEAASEEVHRLDALEKTRRQSDDRDPRRRADGQQPAAPPRKIGKLWTAGGNPKHRRDRKKRNKMNQKERG